MLRISGLGTRCKDWRFRHQAVMLDAAAGLFVQVHGRGNEKPPPATRANGGCCSANGGCCSRDDAGQHRGDDKPSRQSSHQPQSWSGSTSAVAYDTETGRDAVEERGSDEGREDRQNRKLGQPLQPGLAFGLRHAFEDDVRHQDFSCAGGMPARLDPRTVLRAGVLRLRLRYFARR